MTKTNNFVIDNFVVDSRKVQDGDCFIAIKGENNNGNLYLEAALDNGASVCIVDEMPNKEIIEKLVLQDYIIELDTMYTLLIKVE